MQEIDSIDKMSRWLGQHEDVLKSWSETAYSYEILHNRLYEKYRRMNIKYTLPTIILSTIAGTANFSQASIPDEYKEAVSLGTGAINLICGIITTIAQFLKISELKEAHRASAQGFGKIARLIEVELKIPRDQRGENGLSFLNSRRVELSQLLEQAPLLEETIAKRFVHDNKKRGFNMPNITTVQPIKIYRRTSIQDLESAMIEKAEQVEIEMKDNINKSKKEIAKKVNDELDIE